MDGARMRHTAGEGTMIGGWPSTALGSVGLLLLAVVLAGTGCGAAQVPVGADGDGPVREAVANVEPAGETTRGDAVADGPRTTDAASPEGERAGSARGDVSAAPAKENESGEPLVPRESAPLVDTEDFPGEPPREGVTGPGPAPGTALAAKYEAGRILLKMDPEGGFDPRLAFAELKAGVERTMGNDVFLQKGKKAFDHDERAVIELLEVPAGGQEERARKALGKILEAERIVVARPLKAGKEMYGKETSQGRREARRAERLLAEADAAARSGREQEAVSLYREAWESMNESRTVVNGVVDPDGDGLDFRVEKKAGTHPQKGDTDGDGVGDGKELFELITDPLKPDPAGSDRDGDGVTDREELKNGTDPLLPQGG